MRINRLNELIHRGNVIKGRWKLGPHDTIAYQAARDGDERVNFETELIAFEPGLLVLGVTQKKNRTDFETTLVKLRGHWKSNDKNQLTFEAQRESGKRDILTFQGAWKLNRSHEIVYKLRKTRLKTKTRQTQVLTLKGHWDLTGKNRLVYYVGGESAEALRFRGAFQTQSVLAKKGEIRYQLGAEFRGRKRFKTVVLFGTWKFSRTRELFFEVEYGAGVRKKIHFGGAVLMRPDAKFEVLLTLRGGEPLGVELIFTRNLPKENKQLFVRLKKTAEESALEAGVVLKW